MVKFVGNDESGLPLKRKQVAQACDSCRKRKKRCVHEYDLNPEDNSPTTYNSESPTKPVRRVSHNAGETPDLSPIEMRSQGSVQGSVPPQPEPRAATRFVGDLNPRHLFIEATSPHSARDLSVRGGIGVWESRSAQDGRSTAPRSTPSLMGPSQTMQSLLIKYVQTSCQTCIPAVQDWYVLKNIYLEKQDPLYPVLNTALADGHDANAILVKQVISLAAAANSQATSYLRLLPSGMVLSRADFTATLSAAIHATIESGLITDRILLIRVLLLFSMYMQPTCPEEADMPTAIFSKAAHQFMTLGLQLPMEGAAEAEYEDTRCLFLCTWALDRLNSAVYGRACSLHERDIGWPFEESIKLQKPPFRLLLSVVRLLEEVIGLYRPQKDHEFSDIDMPILEQLIIDAEATRVPETLLATIEVFYHAVAILSCRVPTDTTRSALPSRANNSRRSLSADRITELVRDELRDRLSYMPIIPYAVSLSLSVMYRKMRYSQIPMFRERGLRGFEANTKLLKQLGETFWSARTTGEMAERVLQEMGKAARSKAQGSGENSVREGSDPQPPPIQPPFSGVPRIIPPMSTLPPPGSSIPLLSPEGLPAEIDVWDHMNPQFNMNAIEAAFQGTLDMQASWFDWQQNATWAI